MTRILRDAGHGVHTPTLTGLGNRSDILDPEVGLDTHVADVVEVLMGKDLRDVTLVGHSYAGMVISGVPFMTVVLPYSLGVALLGRVHRGDPSLIMRVTAERVPMAR